MSIQFNKVFFGGNLTRDPQLSYLPSQTPVVEFGMASNRPWTGQDGQKKEEVCFVDCRAFGKQAETLNQYMAKGKPLFVEGRLHLDTWEDPQGNPRQKLRITVERFCFVGQAADAQQQSAPSPQSAPPAQQPAQRAPEGNLPPQDENIPF